MRSIDHAGVGTKRAWRVGGETVERARPRKVVWMRRLTAVSVCCLVLVAGLGCSYHRAYISYPEYEEAVQVASTGWEGRRLGVVSAGEGGALWERCTDVAKGSLWLLMEDTRNMGGNAIGEVRWVPQDSKRTSAEPTCKKKWGWFLVWPVLVTPGFMSAKVEGVAYVVPDSGATRAGLYRIPEDAGKRAALAQRILKDMAALDHSAGIIQVNQQVRQD